MLKAGLTSRFDIVFAFRFTQKLLERLSTAPDPRPAPPDTVLGDWHANLVRAVRTQLVLAVSERTLLPVVVPVRDGRSLVRRLTEDLESMLTAVGIPAEGVIAERSAMQCWVIGNTANRRILGSLNDLAFQLKVGLLDSPGQALLAQSLWLVKTPLKIIEYGSPDRATVVAFTVNRALHRASSR